MYEWRCSPYDSVRDEYYVPNFGTSGLFLSWLVSTVGVTYVYPINSSELNCAGIVTALEFCYNATAFFDDKSTKNAFNFLLLNRQIDNVFEVTKVIQVTATPFQASCISGYPRRCCETMEFKLQDRFSITSPDLAIGFGPPQDNTIRVSHQGLHTAPYPMYSGFFYATNSSLSLGSTVDLKYPIEQSLRIKSNYFILCI